MIRECVLEDAQRVTDIYNHYIENTTITFETVPVIADAMLERIRRTTDSYPWLVFEENERVVGYAYAGPWNARWAYRHSSETSIYLDADNLGKGIGIRLYRALIRRLCDQSLHCIIGGVALPNDASIALHEKMGFEKVAHFKQVGWKLDRWVDVGYWELLLEEVSSEAFTA